jgi:hypothetical protein
VEDEGWFRQASTQASLQTCFFNFTYVHCKHYIYIYAHI